MLKRGFKENQGLTIRLAFSAAAVLIASLLAFMSCAGNSPGSDTKSPLAGKSWSVTSTKDGSTETLTVAITETKIVVLDSTGKVISTQAYEYKDELYLIDGYDLGIAITADSSGLKLGAEFVLPGYTDFAAAGGPTALDSGTIGDLNKAETGDTPVLDKLPASGTLNTGLLGVWQLSYAEGTDTYIITDGSIDHPDGYGWTSASIEYVYNFDEASTSGGLIVKYTDDGVDKYDAVWFSGLTATQVLLGNAFFVEDYTQPTAVDTLTDAIVRFKPENAAIYGGGEAQGGSPQLKQTIPASGTLNTGLHGVWKLSYTGGTDTYIITDGSIDHPDGYGWTSASIEYVYNFNSTSGGLIVKYTDDGAVKYDAVWFSGLNTTQVLLGNAWFVEDYTQPTAVDTLEAAKIRFWPANAALYGGGDAQGGSPQLKQTIPATGTLNTGLLGTWKTSGDEWTDTYTIIAGTGSQIGSIEHEEGWTWTNATIEYVYNFDETSGGLIVKYTTDDGTDKFNAVWFKDLTATQVLLGDAFTVADYTIDSAVDTLEAAKIRFWPANATNYGGAEAQGGSPQLKQP